MKHEHHGFTHAADHTELERNKKNGWVVDAPREIIKLKDEKQTPAK